MAHVHIFAIAGIGLFLSIVLLTFNCDVVSGVEFLEKPENVTLDSYEKPYTLNCSVDVATDNGIDWVAYLDEGKKVIFESLPNVCSAGYSVERPNNRTVNLIIRAANFQNSSVAGEYCCHGEDGQGPIACAYVTVTDVSRSPHTDANEITATTNNTPTTSTYLSSTHGSASNTGEIVGGVVGGCIVVALVLLVLLLVCICHPTCPIHRHCNRNSPSNVNHVENVPEQQNMLNL